MPLSQLLKNSGRELKAELQLILNAVVGGLCGLDAAGNVTFCNDALLKMTGYRTDEMIGNNLHELLHRSRPDGTQYPAAECTVRKAMNAHQAIHIVGELFWRKDGTSFPTEYWMHPLPEPSSVTEYVATIQDITEIQRDQDALRRSDEKFRRILASVPDVAWTSDRDGRTIYISPKVESIFGYTNQEICAGSANLWLGCIHPEDFGRVRQAYGALFEKQIAFDQEYRIRRKDGAWIWVYDRAAGTREENGVLYADGILSDITRRKQAEAELQSKTAFLEAQANATIDGILVVDDSGRRILQNQRYSELLKIPGEMLSNKDDRDMLEYVVTLIKDPASFLAKVHYLHGHPSETSRDEIEFKDGMILDRYSSPVVD
ncbi:MAG: PAS domain S-box protein, partial [Terriglobales bacterium]